MLSRVVIFLSTFRAILGQDLSYFHLKPSEYYWTTTQSPRVVDIYTNHDDFQEVLQNYQGFSNKAPVKNIVYKFPKAVKIDPKPINRLDKLESDFGEIVGNAASKFVYIDQNQFSPSISHESVNFDKLNSYQDRRPRFKTQKYNYTTLSNNKLSYVQKIPLEDKKSSTTKSKINQMLKDYLIKLYKEKYNRRNDSRLLNHYKNDDALKSKLFDQTLWSLKNKTKLIVNKLFSLFTVIQFANSRCNTTSSTSGAYEGICYTQQECTNLNGTAMGNCANGYGVCCVFRGSCGGGSSQNCTYFESPNYPNYYPSDSGVIVPTTQSPLPTPDPRWTKYYQTLPYEEFEPRQADNTRSCVYSVTKLNDDIKQMRIDFIDLELADPANGTCVNEQLVISGQSPNTPIPAICGYNTGQHMYVDVSMLNGPLMLSVLSTVVANKRFKIRICQFAGNTSDSCISNNCLQYFTGVTGVITSFNYDQAAMYSRSNPGYMNNLNYAICIRREAGYCSITYTNVMNGVEYPFQLRNIDDTGITTVPAGQAGVDITNCPDDYIVIDGTRLCGDKFNDGSMNEDFTQNAPVTDTSAGPIVIPVRTDAAVSGIGFKLFYTQNRCT